MKNPKIPLVGTQEFAEYVRGRITASLEEIREEVGKDLWDAMVTVIYGCSFSPTGMNFNMDGNIDAIPVLLGISIRELAHELRHHPRFVDCRGQEHKIAARITHEVINYAKHSAPEKPT
jgi:hypothetical protein